MLATFPLSLWQYVYVKICIKFVCKFSSHVITEFAFLGGGGGGCNFAHVHRAQF